MRRTIGAIGGIMLGLGLSQFPEYAQQYEQRLGGAVDELRAIVTRFDTSAARAGLNRGEALDRYADNRDSFIVGQGGNIKATIARYDRLRAHLADLQGAGPVERMADMARYYDPEIGARAAAAYKPAIPVTPEGFALGGIGIVTGYGLVAALGGLVRRRNRIRVRRR